MSKSDADAERRLRSLRAEIQPTLDEIEREGRAVRDKLRRDAANAERRARRLQRRRARRRRIRVALGLALVQLIAFLFAVTPAQKLRRAEQRGQKLAASYQTAVKRLEARARFSLPEHTSEVVLRARQLAERADWILADLHEQARAVDAAAQREEETAKAAVARGDDDAAAAALARRSGWVRMQVRLRWTLDQQRAAAGALHAWLALAQAQFGAGGPAASAPTA